MIFHFVFAFYVNVGKRLLILPELYSNFASESVRGTNNNNEEQITLVYSRLCSINFT